MLQVKPGLGLIVEHNQGTGHLDSPTLGEEPAPQHMKLDWEFYQPGLHVWTTEVQNDLTETVWHFSSGASLWHRDPQCMKESPEATVLKR